MTPTLIGTSGLLPRAIQLICAAVGLLVLGAAASGCAAGDTTSTSQPIDDAALQSDRPTTQPTIANPTAPPATAVPVAVSAAATPAPLPSPELDAAISSTPGPLPTRERAPNYGTLEYELMQPFRVDQERTLDDTLALAEYLGVNVADSQGSACFNKLLASRDVGDAARDDSYQASLVIDSLIECVGIEALQAVFVHMNIFAANWRGSAALPDLVTTRSCDKAMPPTDARESGRFAADLQNVLLSVSPTPTSIAFGCRRAMQQTKEYGEVDRRCFSGDVALKALPKQITTIVAELDQPCLWVTAYGDDNFHSVLHPDGFVGWVSASEVDQSDLRRDPPRVELYGTDALCTLDSTPVHVEPTTTADVVGVVDAGSCGVRWDGEAAEGWLWVTHFARVERGTDPATLVETTGWIPETQTLPIASVNSPQAAVGRAGHLAECSVHATESDKATCGGSHWTWMRASSTCSNQPGVGYWTDVYSLWTTFELEIDGNGEWAATDETRGGLAVQC